MLSEEKRLAIAAKSKLDLTYDSGPYEVTTLRCATEELFDAIEAAVLATIAEMREAQSTDQRLLNLLCRIHRDGGHYIAEHGLDKAVEDADLRVAEQNAALDAQAEQEPVPGCYIDNTYGVVLCKPGQEKGKRLFRHAAPVVQPDDLKDAGRKLDIALDALKTIRRALEHDYHASAYVVVIEALSQIGGKE